MSLPESYELCRHITARYAKTFYLGTMLMSAAKRKAVWALYAWCRRTDELVDGLNAEATTTQTLQEWEHQLESAFAGNPLTPTDVALSEAIKNYPIPLQPFKDMIAGMQMDLYYDRYSCFDDLHLYCYRVAGTVGLMSAAVMGFERSDAGVISGAMEAAVSLGIAMQLTNILRDIGEDADRGRIYLPIDELHCFDYTEADLFQGVLDDRWVALMQFQINRAREFYKKAEQGISALCQDARWPVWASLMLYQNILSSIEKNNYQVFSRRAFVPTSKKIFTLPWAWLRAQIS